MKLTEKWLMRAGVIYILQVRGKGPLKVGFTENDVTKRVAAIQSGLPYEIDLIDSFQAIAQDELDLHKALARFRIRGEWYQPAAEVLEVLAAKCPDLRSRDKVQREPQVEKVFGLFGGLHGIAAICGVGISAVCQWRKGIPPRHHRALLAHAKERGIPFTLDDFYDSSATEAA